MAEKICNFLLKAWLPLHSKFKFVPFRIYALALIVHFYIFLYVILKPHV